MKIYVSTTEDMVDAISQLGTRAGNREHGAEAGGNPERAAKWHALAGHLRKAHIIAALLLAEEGR